jgi:hypothetical protein
MDKAIFGGSLACVLFLIAGTFLFPTSPIMWLAGTSVAYTIFRVIMAGMLLIVLFTTPPRKLFVLLAMGVMAMVLAGWGIELMLQGSYKLLDMIMFVELGIAFGLAALEVTNEDVSNALTSTAPKQRAHRTKTA